MTIRDDAIETAFYVWWEKVNFQKLSRLGLVGKETTTNPYATFAAGYEAGLADARKVVRLTAKQEQAS